MLPLDTKIIWSEPRVRIRIPQESLSFSISPRIIRPNSFENELQTQFVELFHGGNGSLHTYIHGEILIDFLKECRYDSWKFIHETRGNTFVLEDQVRNTVVRLLQKLENMTFTVSCREKVNKSYPYIVLDKPELKHKNTNFPLLSYWPNAEIVLSTPELRYYQDDDCLVTLTDDRQHAVIRVESHLYNSHLYVLLNSDANTYKYVSIDEIKRFVNGSIQPIRV